ncbi:MAG: thioredoxin domain-containing protein [Acidobacteriaceae bacterium]|nr:thioredoxin domain-containing protein [Acidobacteriaceae bacterium]
MRTLLFAAAAALTSMAAALPHSPGPPHVEKARLESYLRYADGYTPEVNVAIDDPLPSPFPGYYRLVVHLSAGRQKFDRIYYLTADGQHLVSGVVWDLNLNPFIDNVQHLPTSGPSFGPANAPVTIVVFSDFECPYCRALAQTIRTNIPQRYPNEIRVIFADFPLNSIHPWAQAAAEASHCIGDSNPESFWALHDWIFDHQDEINKAVIPSKEVPPDLSEFREKLLAYVNEKHLDTAKITNCLNTHETAPEVAANEQKARAVQVQETPTLFVNGRMVSGAVDWKNLEPILSFELHRPKDIPASTTESCCSVTIPSVRKK